MARWLGLALVATLACGSHHEHVESTQPQPHPQPPPPPPPPAPKPQPVPPVIDDFVNAHASDAGAWRVTLSVQAAPGTTRTALVSRPVGNKLVERLVKPDAYVDGEYGCVGTPLHIEIVRGAASLPLDVDCGHLYLSAHGHDGPWVTLSPDMVQFIDGIRATVLP